MIMNVAKEYPTSEKGVRRNKEIKGILKMIYGRRLIKKKRMPNQWPDYPI